MVCLRRFRSGILKPGALAAFVAGTLAIAVYLNALDNPFVFDDRTEILENQSIRDLSQVPTLVRSNPTRPLTYASYAVDFAFWGEDPFGYHLTNVLLHAVNVALLFVIMRRLLRTAVPGAAGSEAGAFVASTLFAVHPMMTEAVGYVSGRAEVLCGTLFLASFYCFQRAFSADTRRAILLVLGGIVLFVLSVATKEVGVMLPSVILAYDLLVARRSHAAAWRRRLWSIHVPLIALVVAVGLARVWWYIAVEHTGAPGSDWRNVLVELHVLERYLSLLALPTHQSLVHAVYPFTSIWDARLISAVAIVGGALILAFVMRRRRPLVSFGIIWFFLVALPSTALILLVSKGQPMAEHRVYLASCGIFLACGDVARRLLHGGARARVARWTALAVVLAILIGLTIARNRVWSDPVSLWGDAARKAPFTYVAQSAAADAYADAGDCDTAVPLYRRALSILPGRRDAYLGLGACLNMLGRLDEARGVLRQATAKVPTEPSLWKALAQVEERAGNYAEALRVCREGLAHAAGAAELEECVRRNERLAR